MLSFTLDEVYLFHVFISDFNFFNLSSLILPLTSKLIDYNFRSNFQGRKYFSALSHISFT
jgi:hypothetical protein